MYSIYTRHIKEVLVTFNQSCKE